MNLNSIRKICVLTLLAASVTILTFAGCGRSTSANLDALYEANTTAAILKDHSSVYEEFTYHENLDDEVTFRTSYCYAEQEDGKAVYQAEGNDAADASSEDNFSYCIVDNIEYLVNYQDKMIIYPLTASYIEDFKSNSFTVSINDAEKLSSAHKEGSEIILTTSANASDMYSSDTLKSLNSLSNDTISKVKTIYTAYADTMLLSNVKMYYVGETGKEYLFSEKNVTYDTTVPDVSFADGYINPGSTRYVTVIEKNDSGDTSNIYTIPATVTPDYKCFESYYGYTLYNDADGLDPYTGESPDASGLYQNITLYAIEKSDSSSASNASK